MCSPIVGAPPDAVALGQKDGLRLALRRPAPAQRGDVDGELPPGAWD